jgi:hypothetical protein
MNQLSLQCVRFDYRLACCVKSFVHSRINYFFFHHKKKQAGAGTGMNMNFYTRLNDDLHRLINEFVGSQDALNGYRFHVMPELLKTIKFRRFKYDQTCTVRNYSERTFKCVVKGRIFGSYRREDLVYFGKSKMFFLKYGLPITL